nr:AAA family ATPase [Brevibacterium gallinarum]
MLSVSSLKGGVGKTSVTLGLASAAYSRGIPTLVIDMDPQADASTGLDIPVRTEVDIADVLAAPRKRILERAVVPSGWVGDQRGHIDVISGSPRAAEFDQPTLSLRYLRRLSEAIHKAGTGYRLVLIDCPPSLNGLTRAAWTASSRVLIVTEPGLFSVAAADRALRATDELRRRTASDLQPLGIVVNRARLQSREHSYRIEELREMFGPLVVNPPIPERTVLQQAQGSARPIHSWPGKPAAELAAAFDKILDRALRSERIRRKADAKATPASSTAAADSSGDTQKPEADAAPDERPTTPQKNVGDQDRAGAVEEPATQPAEPSTSTPVEKSEESLKPTDIDAGHDSASNGQNEPDEPAEQNRDEDEKRSAAPTESDSGEEARSSKEQDAKGTPEASTAADAESGPASAAEIKAREESPSQTIGVRPQSPMGAQPPKPRSAPTVGSQPTGSTTVSAQPAQPSSQQDDSGVETAAMPLVDTDTGPAQIHEPAGGEEAFLTRRELRERREREKSSKRKWFGR